MGSRAVILIGILLSACTQLPVREYVSSADGVRIACSVSGEGSTALLFIHGGFCDSELWSNQMEAFSDEFKVVTLDLAGHGKSGSNRSPWTLDAFGEDVKAVVAALGLERVVLIGHSMGGPVGLKTAQMIPGRVIGVIGVDTLHNADAEWDREAWQARMDLFQEDFGDACKKMVRGSFPDSTDQAIVAQVMDKANQMDSQVGLSILESFSDYDMAAEMQKVKAPIRCINGDLWPTSIEGNRKYAPGFKAIIISGSGHYPMLEWPEEFNSQLAKILRSL